MPSRKKSNLSQKTLASEKPTPRESRLCIQRALTAASRSRESIEGREAWLSADQERHALSRESETFNQRESHLSSQRILTATLRSQESLEEREAHLSADRERHALSCESETFTERELRLSSQRILTAPLRSQESIEEREARLSANLERHTLSREMESLSERERRRTEERIGNMRQIETAEQRQSRLGADRARYHVNRFITGEADESLEYYVTNIIMPWENKKKAGFMYSSRIDYASYASVGCMTEICNFCDALKWKKEANGMCCSSGKVVVQNFQDPPNIIKTLINGNHPQSKHFLNNIRSYNSAFQMTSFGAKQITEAPFKPTFKVQGQVYHLIGSLLPDNEHRFLQIYFISNYTEQQNIRNRNFPQLDGLLISELQNMLHQVNR
ncbi:unnamed protein product [Euphydryas editha]|uniref:Helitron helicase-like domain-containing protein n=1 Tax=Euphydryas editha TaxID=104508 RepID=A0AAU9UGP5_EUPED|nr:unnamed protein product [Euphydryas editha]